MNPHGYPEPRDVRYSSDYPSRAPKYEVVESAPPLVCANAAAQVIRFSGSPDSIDLSAVLFPVIFTLQNDMGVTLGEVTVGPGIPYTSNLGAMLVLARNAIAGSNATASAIGKWTRERQGSPDPTHEPGWVAP
jgi:hypothetical protein